MPAILSCDAERQWYRDVLISPDELYCSPRVPDAPPRFMSRPTGMYDAAAYVKKLPAPWSDPSLFAVLDDAAANSVACNLAGLRCPKVLIVCDTHHICAPGQGPIWRALRHTLTERYDLVIGQFDRHHLHFFREAGVNAAWLPCTTLTPFEHPPTTPKRHDVTFVGNTGIHPFRHHILEQLGALGISVGRGSAPQRQTADLHAESRINLNISLNGDLNLRHFEVLAAGGFLISERLSPESGQSLLLEDHRHMATFDNVLQLAELIAYYLAHPAAAAEIAAAGQAEYLRFHRPAMKIQQLFDLLAGKIPPTFDLRLDWRTALPAQNIDALRARVALYEFLQELHRTNLLLEVLFWPGAERHAADAIDLPRLRATIVRGNPAGAALLVHARLDDRTTWILPAALQQRTWNVAVCPAAALADPALQQALATRRWGALAIADWNSQRDDPAIRAFEQRFGLKRISADPPAFALPPVSR